MTPRGAVVTSSGGCGGGEVVVVEVVVTSSSSSLRELAMEVTIHDIAFRGERKEERERDEWWL